MDTLQYKAFDFKTEKFSPYPITLSRDRVTEEGAKVTFLKPDHPVLNSPNQITASDFEGWVQERGLYFPSEWSEDYDAILSWHDIGEEAKEGSLLVAEYGEGHYVYTGISFFRELPAGVPGAQAPAPKSSPPLEEHSRLQGVSWCPQPGYIDCQRGRVASGPLPPPARSRQ